MRTEQEHRAEDGVPHIQEKSPPVFSGLVLLSHLCEIWGPQTEQERREQGLRRGGSYCSVPTALSSILNPVKGCSGSTLLWELEESPSSQPGRPMGQLCRHTWCQSVEGCLPLCAFQKKPWVALGLRQSLVPDVALTQSPWLKDPGARRPKAPALCLPDAGKIEEHYAGGPHPVQRGLSPAETWCGTG